MRSIVFTEQYFYPEGWSGAQLTRDIVCALQEDGYQVTVVCGSTPYVEPIGVTVDDPSRLGVRIIRLASLARTRSFLLRAINHLAYSFQSFAALLAQHKADLIIVQTNPPPIVIIAGLVAWICRKPLVIIAMDLYPDALLAFRPSFANPYVARMLAMPFAWAYSHARFVVALGPCMADRLYRKGVLRNRIRVISNWATGDLRVRRGADNQLLDQWQLKGCFTILYSGSLGIAHEIDTILASLSQLRTDCPDLRLLCVASGTRLEAAQQAVQAAELQSAVLFRKLVPPESLPDTMGMATLALVSMRPGFEGVVVPSKFAGYLARGIPILYIGPKSDISRFIEDASAGACFANGDVQGVCQFLRDLTAEPARLRAYGVAAQSYYERNLAIDHGLSAYRGLIADAILR